MARAVEDAGADAISAINTLPGLAVAADRRGPRSGSGYGGLCGPALRPIALRVVYEVAQVVDVPVIGIGGDRDARRRARPARRGRRRRSAWGWRRSPTRCCPCAWRTSWPTPAGRAGLADVADLVGTALPAKAGAAVHARRGVRALMLPRPCWSGCSSINVVTAIAYAWDKTAGAARRPADPGADAVVLLTPGRVRRRVARVLRDAPQDAAPLVLGRADRGDGRLGRGPRLAAVRLNGHRRTIPSTSTCRPRRSGTRGAAAARGSSPWRAITAVIVGGDRHRAARPAGAHAASRLVRPAHERPNCRRRPFERPSAAPDPSAILADTPPRLSREDLEAAVLDGSLDGRLVFVEGVMRATRVPCEGRAQASRDCVDLEIPGIGVPVRPARRRPGPAWRVDTRGRASRRPTRGWSPSRGTAASSTSARSSRRRTAPARSTGSSRASARAAATGSMEPCSRWTATSSSIRSTRAAGRAGRHPVPRPAAVPGLRRAPRRRHPRLGRRRRRGALGVHAGDRPGRGRHRGHVPPRAAGRRRGRPGGWSPATSRRGPCACSSPEARPGLDSRAMPHDPRPAVGRRPRARPRAQARRGRAVPRRAPAIRRAARARPRASMPNGVPMAWHGRQLPPPAAVGRRGHGRPLHRRRRPQYRDFNIADMSMFCGYAPEPLVRAVSRADRPRQPVPAADRGRDRRVRGARPAVRAAEVAVHELRDPGEHRGDPRGPGRDRPRQGPACSTASTTATSTRRWSSSTTDGRLVPEERGVPADTVERHGPRPVQRSRGARAGARAARHRDRADGARDHQQHRPAPARRRASTPSSGG